ncbi:hypothetical protein HRI_001222500 [Hibiscus trionum]|uniref:Uncharacterized protein n=1 Tax=Hibiscus trionum TaxID=183268 RepID=A0A9W7HDL7_HIBTR|nr:hypothetical protein HRI_001222500 [Hibiscus trionum]
MVKLYLEGMAFLQNTFSYSCLKATTKLVTEYISYSFNVLSEQVLRILDGDLLMDTNYASPGYDIGNHSGRICADQQQYYSGSLVNEALDDFSGKLSLDGLRLGTRQKTSCEDHL